jgi:probable HAF family extracellular repeat protein
MACRLIRWMRRIVLAGCLALWLSHSAVADPLYTVTDMGSAVSGLQLSGINDLGQVVGEGPLPVNGTYGGFGFLYNSWGNNAGLIQNIGGLGTSADAISNSGQVMLNAASPNSSASGAWVLNLSDGSKTPVANLLSQPTQTVATAMNDQGQVVGYSQANPNNASITWPVFHAFVSQNGQTTDIGTLPGGSFSYATAINNNGQIAGYANFANSTDGSQPQHAFLYSNGVMRDLGTLGGTQSFAYGINGSGQVVGSSTLATATGAAVTSHAFLYSGGVMQDLGTLGGQNSYAYAVNNSGQIVGSSELAPTPAELQSGQNVYHAFLYESGKMIDLNSMISATSGFTITGATAINNLGQIIATGTGANGSLESLLLTPSNLPTPAAVIDPFPGPEQPVPEPSTLAFIAVVGAALGLRRCIGRR